MAATPRRCGNRTVADIQFRLLRKVKGKSVAESFSNPAAFRQAAGQVHEYHRLQDPISQLTAVNEQICRLRPVAPGPSGWTEAEKKRLPLFIKRSLAKSRRCSKYSQLIAKPPGDRLIPSRFAYVV